MISIGELVSLQSEKEKTGFIQFLENRNKRHDTKNITLYKDFLKGDEKRLLGELSPNAYNALKKRLCDQLIDYSATHVLANELSSESKVIRTIAIARKLLLAGHYKSGLNLLKRAEKIAISLGHHSMLNEIYHSMIAYSHQGKDVDLEALFRKLERNNEQFIAQERLSVLYASMQNQFITRSLNMMPSALHDMYDAGVETFGINKDLAMSFKNLNQLCILTDLYASQRKNYTELDLFFEESLAPLQGSGKDDELSLGHHIELLYGLANIYFRRYHLKKSMFYLNQMHEQMQRFDRKFFDLWDARYVNLLALNYNFAGMWKQAYALIQDCLNNQKLTEKERALLNLSLSMIHFQQGDFAETKRIVSGFKKSDAWYLKVMGNEWLFNFKAMEVLLHFDLGNMQLAESLISSFRRKYAIHFKNKKDNPVYPFLLLVKSILYKPTSLRSKEFAEKVETSLPWNRENEDFFNLCFYAWLKAKMKNQTVYGTTLDLLKYNVVE